MHERTVLIEAPPSRPTMGSRPKAIVRAVLVAVCAGALGGLLVAGVGGRLAMFVLRITSADSVRGIESDDGFIIGQLSFESLFLVAICIVGGAFNGLCYTIVRTFLPERHRPRAWGLLGAAIGGSLIIHPDGIDFVFLTPLWLAVVMFTLLPGLASVLIATTIERWSVRPRWYRRRVGAVSILPALLCVVVLPLAAATVVGTGLAAWLSRFKNVRAGVESKPAALLVRTVLLVLFAVSAVALIRDAADILTA